MRVPSVELITEQSTWIIHNDTMLCTETGQLEPTYKLQSFLRSSLVGGFICGTRLYEELAPLNEILEDLPDWQMRTSIIPRMRRGLQGPQGQAAMRGEMRIDYLSFKTVHASKQLREHRVRWKVFNLEAFTDTPPDTLKEKHAMVTAILGMLKRRGTKFRPSRGSNGAAMLKASPLWLPTLVHPDTKVPFKRRCPAPRFVNDISREHLPGNHYAVKEGLLKRVETMDHCFLIDQNSAHHTITSTTPIPHPEWIHARGFSNQHDIDRLRMWCKPDSDIGRELSTSHYGLVYAVIQVGHLSPSNRHLYPPWAQKPGTRGEWLWTPELRMFHSDKRINILHYVCALTATRQDDALREYAQWCLHELTLPDKKYKKSTMLAAYGILAMNTQTKNKMMYAWAGSKEVNGTPMFLPILGDVKVRKLTTDENVQPVTLNVAARGTIEAETRTRSIEYARELSSQGFTVAQIYVDGLLVHADQLPFIREGWRVSDSLHNVSIPQVNGFRSDEMSKLPGTPRTARLGQAQDAGERFRRRDAWTRTYGHLPMGRA